MPAEISKLPAILCVDCDGTLIRTDLLHESLWRFLRANPLRVVEVVAWLMTGRARLKRELAGRVAIPYELLPLRENVVSLIKEARAGGREVFLVTASSQTQADQIAGTLGIFDGVFGTDGDRNLKGKTKAAFLVEKFGAGRFAYAGDSWADLPVWAAAGAAIVVSPSRRLAEKARLVNSNMMRLDAESPGLRDWLREIRLHQWAKNLIIFVPLMTSHRVLDAGLLRASLLAFLSFGCIASATYILNDLLDLDHDRRHAGKRNRPMASGRIGIFAGLLMALALAGVGVAVGGLLPGMFGLCLALYVLLTLSYSLYVKRVMLADAVLLAGLYCLRLYAGMTATGIQLSVWLIAFSIFIFFSLALAKRFAEIRPHLATEMPKSAKLSGRGYTLEDLPALAALGSSSGLISVLVLVLYVNSPEVLPLYQSPKLLLLLVPLFLYWIGRIWMVAQRGELHEDPVLYALKDLKSYLIAAAAIAVILAAARLQFH